MRHKKLKHQLNRFTSWRQATLSSLVRSLLINQSISTTKHKALAVKPLAEKLISLGKANTLNAKRAAFRVLQDHKLVTLLFADIAPRFASRQGGYLRILNLERRRGDNAEMVLMELTEIKKKEHKKAVKEEKAGHQEGKKPQEAEGKPQEEQKARTETAVKEERPPISKKPPKKFLGGIRNIFKKERDSL